jgi:hypothetical protein
MTANGSQEDCAGVGGEVGGADWGDGDGAPGEEVTLCREREEEGVAFAAVGHCVEEAVGGDG